MRIVVYAPGEETAVRACQAVFKRAADLEQIMSDYRPDSELMKLCSRAVGKWGRVSRELFYVLQRAQKLASQTSGAFDVTVGNLVQLWRRARQLKKLPSEAELAEARAKTGWQKMNLNVRLRAVRLQTAGMRLDLGGIAKGYACDEALKIFRRRRLPHALIEMGGDIVVGDAPPGQDGWRIDIALDDETTMLTGRQKDGRTGGREEKTVRNPKFTIRNWRDPNSGLRNAAISTSGDTEQFVEIDGVRYSHILDPRTGLGLTTRAMATVTARDGLTSDSLATAACVLGEPEAYGLQRYYRDAEIRVKQVKNDARNSQIK